MPWEGLCLRKEHCAPGGGLCPGWRTMFCCSMGAKDTGSKSRRPLWVPVARTGSSRLQMAVWSWRGKLAGKEEGSKMLMASGPRLPGNKGSLCFATWEVYGQGQRLGGRVTTPVRAAPTPHYVASPSSPAKLPEVWPQPRPETELESISADR